MSGSRKLTEPVATDTGEKVIAGSVRPDGTVRKERRIRAGYTPQEEQPVYQSRGTLAKQNVPTCPGMDEAEISALKQQAAKGKKPSTASSQPAAAKPKPAASQASAPAKAAPPAPAPAAAAALPPPAEPEDPKAALEKQIRALKKKIRQASDLAEKKAAGAALDKDQEEKLARGAAWQDEVSQLEAQLAKLGV
ncbi:hypothetical protein GPECTOR_61g801 [Gonium pectorale]|uniref:WIBG Mago-binding domain-containing protein n=1 Tax=Gonium pectorale TaxID=33097 RepID=A0A150G4U6_GONPE|nr:hypothetical protein GPECTOR_61g801 [Gonium pectorale]|eukprot:KXZ44848.1 hypothetical protein GPECTOR_61g801 [Gonium pectorale]